MGLPPRTLDRLCRLAGHGGAVLDVGCNDGGLLLELSRARPELRLSGIDLDETAVRTARERVPAATIHVGVAGALPFADGSFDLVTCMDVIEHLPEAIRPGALREIRRVLRPQGHLVLETPHRGTFMLLDAQNLRHRFPRVYRRVLRRGVRDRVYGDAQEVVWHEHFSRDQLLALAGPGWQLEHEAYPGLLVHPLVDLLLWPFHRAGRLGHPVAQAMLRAAAWDAARDYGPSRGYEVMLTLAKTARPSTSSGSDAASPQQRHGVRTPAESNGVCRP